MGECPLSHAELMAWQSNIGLRLNPWEVRTLRKLSMDYLTQSQQATDPKCAPPFGSFMQRAIVAKKIDEIFR